MTTCPREPMNRFPSSLERFQSMSPDQARQQADGASSTARSRRIHLPGAGLISPRGPISTIVPVEGFVSLAAGGTVESSIISVQMPFRCIIHEITLGAQGVSDQTKARWSLGLKMKLPRTGEAISRTESGEAYSFFAAWYDGETPKPFGEVVSFNDRISFQVRNYSTDTAYTPSITLAVDQLDEG